MTHIHRRAFLSKTVFTCAGSYTLLSTTQAKSVGPNDRINLGFIGVGIMGRGHLGGFLGQNDVQVVAVCDVVKERRASAVNMTNNRYAKQKEKENYKGCAEYADFRELLKRKDIDAVVIATPDHWHTLPCVLAARAGKDIYCEKPLTRTIGEGRRIVDEVAKAKIIFQTGSQQRSEFGHRFRKAVVMIRQGIIGDIKTIRIGVGAPAIPCDLPGQAMPDGTDWKMWVGPAAMREYNEILCPKGVHKHFPLWRNYREYAGGGLADMGAHHFDIAQWALNTDGAGPVLIEPPTGKEMTGLRYTYANGTQMYHGGPSGCTFEGTKGTIYVDRDKFEVTPRELAKVELKDDREAVYYSTNHHRNWIECIRSRKQTICPSEVGHRSASICHLGNLGYQLRTTLKWDPKAERFEGNDEANKLVNPAYREEWLVA
ncbi:MAG TPA: Gfo/Idh/MocA family oxidoreductase [Gemmatales bacterium]|nr:Gfo/Idh/MocA family oxidoreductase [Gemmatales bacterium]